MTAADEELEVKLAIVKEIFTEKQVAIEAKKAEAGTNAYNQKIIAIIARKQDEALEKLIKVNKVIDANLIQFN